MKLVFFIVATERFLQLNVPGIKLRASVQCWNSFSTIERQFRWHFFDLNRPISTGAYCRSARWFIVCWKRRCQLPENIARKSSINLVTSFRRRCLKEENSMPTIRDAFRDERRFGGNYTVTKRERGEARRGKARRDDGRKGRRSRRGINREKGRSVINRRSIKSRGCATIASRVGLLSLISY